VAGVWEPTVAATVTLPAEHLGALMALCQDRRGELAEHTHLGPGRLLLRRARGRRAAAAARRRGALDAVFAVPLLCVGRLRVWPAAIALHRPSVGLPAGHVQAELP